MKKNKTIIYFLFLLMFAFGCSNMGKNNEEDFTYPSRKNSPRLLFPQEAQINGFSGTAKIFMFITDEGKVEQAGIEESSGHEVLDEAAIDYCYKLEFDPATMRGEPVSSRIVQNFKFNFLDHDYTVMKYIAEINKLYQKEAAASDEQKKRIQNEILNRHREFSEYMDDVMNYNVVLEKVIQPQIQEGWQEYWKSWPLSFLVYHDFLQRYPENDSSEVVKSYMKTSIESDLQYIETSPVPDITLKSDREMLIEKIKMFVEENYPGIRIDNSHINAVNS